MLIGLFTIRRNVHSHKKGDQNLTDLFGSWNRHGEFWIQEDKERKVGGILKYNGLAESDGLFLELEGPLNHEEPMTDLIYREPSDEASLWIFGKSDDGSCISLSEAITPRTSKYAARLEPRIALIGDDYVNSDTRYKYISISFPGLTEFLQLTQKGRFSAEEFIVSFDTEKGGSIYNTLIHSGKQSKSSKSFTSSISFVARDAKPLNEMIELVYAVQYFFTLLFGFPTCVNKLVLETADGVSVSGWYQFRRKSISAAAEAERMALFYRGLSRAEFESALTKWLASSERFLDFTYNFFGNYFDSHPKARVNLVFYAQSLERFHGLTKHSDLPDDLNKALKSVKTHIKTNIEKAQRKPFFDVLNFLAKPSQRVRLEELFMELQAYVPIFYEDEEVPNFVNCVVKTRNYHIHGGDLPRGMLTVLEETIAVQALKLAVHLLLLKHLEIPAEAIRTGAISDFDLWNKHYWHTLGKSVLKAKLGQSSIGSKYEKRLLTGSPCFFCADGTKLQQEAVLRYKEVYIARVFCPKVDCAGNASNRCKVCGGRQVGNDSGTYCSKCNGFVADPV
jgi:hypothetical protein